MDRRAFILRVTPPDFTQELPRKVLQTRAKEDPRAIGGRPTIVRDEQKMVTTGRHALDVPVRESGCRTSRPTLRCRTHFRLGICLRRHGVVEKGTRTIDAGS